jgi:8-oxo-dGTP diphosphatase
VRRKPEIFDRTVAKIALFNPEGLVLLLKRSERDKRMPGEWDFPGGTIKPGEIIIEGAIRETIEETNIALISEELTEVHSLTEKNKKKLARVIMFYAYLSIETEVVLSPEHQSYIWTSSEDAMTKFAQEAKQNSRIDVWGDGLRHLAANDIV